MNPSGSRQGSRSQEELFLGNPAGRPPVESPVIGPLRISKRETPSPAPQSAPLPYPDDRLRPQQRHSPSPTADGGRLGGSPTPMNVAAMPAGSGTPRPEYPAALRPRDGREPKQVTLAERRGNVPKPLPDSPAGDAPDRDGLFARNYQRTQVSSPPVNGNRGDGEAYQDYRQGYWPPPQPEKLPGHSIRPAPAQSLQPPNNAINRISSTASTSTTRAQRGSPPPPETPIVEPGQQPGSDIEARYAASGIAGTSTLSGLQAQSAAAQRRAEQYVGQQPRTQPPFQRPWTPTEQPGTQPHGPPTVYQGAGVISTENPPAHPYPAQPVSTPSQASSTPQPARIPPNALEQDLERMRLSSSPPPAYSSVSGSAAAQGYPNEKQRVPAPTGQSVQSAAHPATMTPADAAAPSSAPLPSTQDHPAFANDPRQQQPSGQSPAKDIVQDAQGAQNDHQPAIQQTQVTALATPSGIPPASPPPLPEGWIAHLDPNSGQYYYIHLSTQSTQWEFPKGPTPLNLNETPLSPVGSVYSSHPLSSPGLSAFSKPLTSPGLPMTPGYESLQSPVVAGFTGPPPSSGVDLYKVAPTNGVYFGPYLRYTNMDVERGTWLGSILLVTDAGQPPTIHMHQSVDLSPNPRQLKPLAISVHQRWTFYKYDVDCQMDDSGPAKWTYAITSHLGCTRYEFLVAGRYETNWRLITTSGNDFSLNVNANERSRLGGAGLMWKDIMQKHNEIGGFHAQLSLGGQIYADRMWKEIPSLKQWLTIKGKEARKTATWTAAHEEDVSHAYFHYYTSHFDQPYLRESFAQIPYVCQIDDHDM